MRQHIGWSLVFLSLWLVGCGGDEEEPAADAPEGEPCVSPGLVENTCTCADNPELGTRACTEDRVWTDCRCPTPLQAGQNCHPGVKLRCGACDDGGAERIVTCPDEGFVDCACGNDGADAG